MSRRFARLWRDHSLSIVTLCLFLAFTLSTIPLTWRHFVVEQQDHGQAATLAAFWWEWGYEYTMSLVADVFGALYLITATARYREKGSVESR